jgi:hypothetical protein
MSLFDVIDATWPAAQMLRDGAFVLRNGQGGGKRVSAASLVETDFSGPWSIQTRMLVQAKIQIGDFTAQNAAFGRFIIG